MENASLVKLLDTIEAELRQLGYLQGDGARLTGITTAFGYGQVSFEQWLGQVFLPSAREAVVTGNLPASSQVAGAAYRNLDGVDEASTLLSLLSTFDSKINQLGRTQRTLGGA